MIYMISNINGIKYRMLKFIQIIYQQEPNLWWNEILWFGNIRKRHIKDRNKNKIIKKNELIVFTILEYIFWNIIRPYFECIFILCSDD